MSPTPLPSGELLTGSFDGVVCAWNAKGEAARFNGQLDKSVCGAVHGNKVSAYAKVSGIAVSSAGVVSVGWDDTLRLAPTGALLYSEAVALTGQPCAVAANVHSDLAAVAT
eukprot:16890-Heterococcus_DN1.PRE.1